MEKRGQVSLFIIIAVLVLIIAIGLTYITKTKTIDNAFSKLGISQQAAVVENSILECLKETADGSLIVGGIQGGYYNKPTDYEDLGFAFIPYYYDKGRFLQPSIKTIETELASYVDDNLGFCIDSLYNEDDREINGFVLKYENSKTTSKIKKSEVDFVTDLSLTLSKGDLTEEFELRKHPTTIESKLFEILELATYITDSHKENPELICVSCVADRAEERQLYVDMLNFDNSSTLIVISENVTSSEPYIFEFLNKYPEIKTEIKAPA